MVKKKEDGFSSFSPFALFAISPPETVRQLCLLLEARQLGVALT